MRADAFFAYARERYQTMLNKDADFERPWTQDKILQQYRFCNVFREDDKTTKWVRQHVTFEKYGDKLLGAMVIARWFNRIETMEHLIAPAGYTARADDLLGCWADDLVMWSEVMREALKNQKPLVTAAYMVKTPAKMNKLEGIIWCLNRFLPQAYYYQQVFSQRGYKLEYATHVLTEFPYLGPFMSYEIVTDLRHTPILCNATDIMTWANPGPGAARGLCRVLDVPLDQLDRHKDVDVDHMIGYMQMLLKYSQHEQFWPRRWPKWEMRDVEHTLCEFDKYERALSGDGKPKQRYDGGKAAE